MGSKCSHDFPNHTVVTVQHHNKKPFKLATGFCTICNQTVYAIKYSEEGTQPIKDEWQIITRTQFLYACEYGIPFQKVVF